MSSTVGLRLVRTLSPSVSESQQTLGIALISTVGLRHGELGPGEREKVVLEVP